MKKFAPTVSAYSLQGHFCALKPQTHKWKYLTVQNTKVENTPQRQSENNTTKSNKVGLVHKTKTKTNIKVGHDRHFRTDFGGHVGSAHLYNYCVIVHTDKLYRVFCIKAIVAEGARV
jgi:hypothetical protein